MLNFDFSNSCSAYKVFVRYLGIGMIYMNKNTGYRKNSNFIKIIFNECVQKLSILWSVNIILVLIN